MDKVNFTKHYLKKLSPAEQGKRSYVYDKKVNGLCISITSAGTKSFLVYRKLKGKPIRVTLGHFPDMTIEQARRKALYTLGKISTGINPIDEKRQSAASSLTLEEIFNDYLNIRKDLKAGTILDYRKTINQTFQNWLNKPLQNIKKEMVLRKHAKRGLESKARANNAFRVLRALFNFAKAHYENGNGQSLFPENPAEVLSTTRAWFKISRKKSYITKSELPDWFRTVANLNDTPNAPKTNVVRDYLLFLLFTGTRREEAAKLKWSDINLREGTFTLVDPKNRETVTLPMSNYICKLLRNRFQNTESIFVFPGNGKTGHLVEPRKQILRIRERSGVTFTLHDLRRTFATVAESLDIGRYSLKKLLNHKVNNDADVTAGYIIHNIERLRRVTQTITDHLLNLAQSHQKPQATMLDK